MAEWSLFDEKAAALKPQVAAPPAEAEAPPVADAVEELLKGRAAPSEAALVAALRQRTHQHAPAARRWMAAPAPAGGVLYRVVFDLHHPDWVDGDVDRVRRLVADDDRVLLHGTPVRLLVVWNVEVVRPWRRCRAQTLWHTDAPLPHVELPLWPSQGMRRAQRWIAAGGLRGRTREHYTPRRGDPAPPYTLILTERGAYDAALGPHREDIP